MLQVQRQATPLQGGWGWPQVMLQVTPQQRGMLRVQGWPWVMLQVQRQATPLQGCWGWPQVMLRVTPVQQGLPQVQEQG
jgi:hypothetical protein